MDHFENSLSRSLPARGENVRALRRAVAEFAQAHGASQARCAELELAVAEALNNVVMHAFRQRDGSHMMRVEARADGADVTVTVVDDGGGFAPRDDSPGAGYGVRIMRSLASAVSIGATPGGRGTAVRMEFAGLAQCRQQQSAA
jgi:anti-sigma regulatory factor (Ser/Thr protein kinase)